MERQPPRLSGFDRGVSRQDFRAKSKIKGGRTKPALSEVEGSVRPTLARENFRHVTPVPSTVGPLPQIAACGKLASIMEATDAKSSLLKGEGKGEKLSLLILGLCIAALVIILLIRPF
jgi:hypothetical protein